LVRQQEIERKQRELERKRQVMEAQIVALRADFEAEEEEVKRIIAQKHLRGQALAADRAQMALMRGSDKPSSE
jgi:circadian clock protein KaiC